MTSPAVRTVQEIAVESVGTPARLGGLARMLVKLRRESALHLVAPVPSDDQPRDALSPQLER